MQYSRKDNPAIPDDSEPAPSSSTDSAGSSKRLIRAAIAGTVAAILYLLIFSKSYAAVVGDIILLSIKGDAYYQLGHEQIKILVHSINTILWFLLGGVPFLIVKRITSGFLLLLGIVIGLVLCGFLIIIVAVSPMWP
jgi:hypothetical protein